MKILAPLPQTGLKLPYEQRFLSGMASDIHKLVCVGCQLCSFSLERKKKKTAKRLTSHVDDFIKAKSHHARKKALLTGWTETCLA